MLEAFYTTKIKRDVKLLKKRGYDFKKFAEVVDILRNGKNYPKNTKTIS